MVAGFYQNFNVIPNVPKMLSTQQLHCKFLSLLTNFLQFILARCSSLLFKFVLRFSCSWLTNNRDFTPCAKTLSDHWFGVQPKLDTAKMKLDIRSYYLGSVPNKVVLTILLQKTYNCHFQFFRYFLSLYNVHGKTETQKSS
jgi:hypothetical protein